MPSRFFRLLLVVSVGVAAGVRPRQVAAYGSGKVASRLSLRPLPPAPTCRPLLHNTQVR